VVAIIGSLATVVMVNVSGAKASSRYVKTVAEMSEISKATLQYKAEHNGVWPEQWSGYVNWYKDVALPHCDTSCASHKFYNNITDKTDPYYNDFLVDYMGGKRFKPECPGSAYSFYNYGDYQIIIYWPKNSSGHFTTHYFIQGSEDGLLNILDKTTKKITCKENSSETLAE